MDQRCARMSQPSAILCNSMTPCTDRIHSQAVSAQIISTHGWRRLHSVGNTSTGTSHGFMLHRSAASAHKAGSSGCSSRTVFTVRYRKPRARSYWTGQANRLPGSPKRDRAPDKSTTNPIAATNPRLTMCASRPIPQSGPHASEAFEREIQVH
jgi:hypothetical protein